MRRTVPRGEVDRWDEDLKMGGGGRIGALTRSRAVRLANLGQERQQRRLRRGRLGIPREVLLRQHCPVRRCPE